MSRSKTVVATGDSDLPVSEDMVMEEVLEGKPDQEEEASTSSASSEAPSEPKIGVVRFLQLNPQPKMVEDLMKSMYKKEVHTETEWFDIMDKLLGKNVRTRS